MNEEGYLYCFSNESMPGILKIGMTNRTPHVRLNEANSSDTWRPPTLYKIEFAKKVKDPKQKETILHKLLSQYSERINPKREFFRISQEEVRTFFELIDGELWYIKPIDENDEQYKEDEEEDEADEDTNPLYVKGTRDMVVCFTDGQRIRHVIGITKTLIGIYDSSRNGIICDNYFYKSISGFAQYHYKQIQPNRVTVNGWKECECEVNGSWISTYNL
jgi:hypothetical protein